MVNTNRAVSLGLLSAGVGLVWMGLYAALGATPASLVASAAAVAGLLYGGATWFGPGRVFAQGDPLLVFDRSLFVAAGPLRGTPLVGQFPEPIRERVLDLCAAVIGGKSVHFACDHDGRRLRFDGAPIRAADGTVVYGLLIPALSEAPAVAAPGADLV
jgi:hypothetical protein